MITPPPVNVCIVQSAGDVHALGLLDQAQYFRHQFERLGVPVSLLKNRLRHDAVNLVFGAHAGFDPELTRRFDCLFVNLEPIGVDCRPLPEAYLKLLGQSAAIDVDRRNVIAYASHPEDVPVVSFLHAPYLATPALALEDRPIDLLVIGTMSDRHRDWVARIEAAGRTVAFFDQPLYGPERESFLRQAKAVIDCQSIRGRRFEQSKAFVSLSIGTPVIAECQDGLQLPAAYEEAVFWVSDQELEAFFRDRFASAAWYGEARLRLEAFARTDASDGFADLLAFAHGYRQARRAQAGPATPRRARLVRLAGGASYVPGWLNLDPRPEAMADAVIDLGAPEALPECLESPYAGVVRLKEGEVETICAVDGALERTADLTLLMTRCLALLETGGELVIEVSYGSGPWGWRLPDARRAVSEASWLTYTDGFWQLGWLDHRFDLAYFSFVDGQRRPCERDQAIGMQVALRKVETTPQERMFARTMRADFGADLGGMAAAPPELERSSDPVAEFAR
jgi:hypothetical protein